MSFNTIGRHPHNAYCSDCGCLRINRKGYLFCPWCDFGHVQQEPKC